MPESGSQPRSDEQRPELGGLLFGVTREVLARETALLAKQDLQMWDYVVLGYLLHNTAPAKQSELAAATNRDQTRLIPILDRLTEQGLLVRDRDPADRRANRVRLTAKGGRTALRCRDLIRAMEDDLLDGWPATQRRALFAALVRLQPDRSSGPDPG